MIVDLKTKLLVVAAALIVAMAAYSWHERDGRLIAQGEAKAAQEAREAATETARESEAAREALVVQSEARAAYDSAKADSAVAVWRAAALESPKVIDRIVNREAPADTAVARRVASETADSIRHNEVAPLLVAHQSDLDQIAALKVQLSATDRARVDAQAALRAALTEIGALRKGEPKWTDTALKLVELGGAFAAGRESARLF